MSADPRDCSGIDFGLCSQFLSGKRDHTTERPRGLCGWPPVENAEVCGRVYDAGTVQYGRMALLLILQSMSANGGRR
jgi:hypothetical protein